MLYSAGNMNNRPNLPNEIFWCKEYSWRTDTRVNGWLGLAATISGFTDIVFASTVNQWPLWVRAGIVIAQFFALALWARSMTLWIRGMDEMHRRITTTVMLMSVGATFFFMMLWHRLYRVGLFDVIFAKPKPGASWDICTVCHGFLLFVLFYGIAQAIFNRRYK
jgi:hypothetical protein